MAQGKACGLHLEWSICEWLVPGHSSMHPLTLAFYLGYSISISLSRTPHTAPEELIMCRCERCMILDLVYFYLIKDRHIFFKIWFLGVVSFFTQGLFSKHFWKFQRDFFPPNQIWPSLAVSFGYRVRHSVKYNYRWWSDWRSCKRFPFQWRRCNCHCLVHGLERQHHHWLPLIRATLTSHSTFKNMFIHPR